MTVKNLAKVTKNARVEPTALLKNRAHATDDCVVAQTAAVRQDATVGGLALVGGQALVEGQAIVDGEALVIENAYVGQAGHVTGSTIVGGHARVLTGPFEGGDFYESPIQMVVGRFIVGVDADGALVGLPEHSLTKWENYVLSMLKRALASTRYKTSSEFEDAFNDHATQVEHNRADRMPAETHVLTTVLTTEAATQSNISDAPTEVPRAPRRGHAPILTLVQPTKSTRPATRSVRSRR